MNRAKRPSSTEFINESHSDEFRWWCGHLGCSDLALREAIQAVGYKAEKVRAHLLGRRLARATTESLDPPENLS